MIFWFTGLVRDTNSQTTYIYSQEYSSFNGSHLPLIMIETKGADIIDDVKVMVEMGIIDKPDGNTNYPSNEYNGYRGKAGIEYRGSASLMYPKKNYGIETWTINGKDSTCSLMGMPEETDWVLYGPYSDKALIRNALAYSLFHKMGYYTPRTRFCELFIDRQYQGLYVLIERIKRDSNRVNIAKIETWDNEDPTLTGGYIVKIDRSDDGSYSDGWFSPYAGNDPVRSHPFFAFHYPRLDKISPVQKGYIRSAITHFEDVLMSNAYLDPENGYRSLIDINSFTDFFIINELSRNVDGYRLSTFLYKDRDDRDPRIHMGPAWDFNYSFGNANYLDGYSTAGWHYSQPAGIPFWWERFMTDPVFVNTLTTRWKELRSGLLSDESLLDKIDSLVNRIGSASDRNFIRWPVLGTFIWPNAYIGKTYEDEVNYLKNWVLGRTEWMDENIHELDLTTDTDEHSSAVLVVMAKPNPGIGYTNIEIQNPLLQKFLLEVKNITGQIVYSTVIVNQPLYMQQLNLEPGLYFINILGENTYKNVKFVIM